jgi:hypothetical protein
MAQRRSAAKARVALDVADVLATIPLVQDSQPLTDQLFEQLVALLFAGLLLDLGDQLSRGQLTLEAYLAERAVLAAQGRAAGLIEPL